MASELIKSKSQEETIKIAKNLSSKIKYPLMIGLSGDLGAGKTVFVKGIAEGLGIDYLITSPTFLGVSEYRHNDLSFIHMDFYLKVAPKELIDSYLKDKSVILIEWIENYNSVFGKDLMPDISVYIDYLKDKNGVILDTERQIKIQFNRDF